MTKLKNPLLSLRASGSVAKAWSFLRRNRVNIVEKMPQIKDVRSAPQLGWRHMFNKCVDLWHTLSAAEKAEWESAARSRHMTGYAWYISQCLRPNPGIYLPLQGGTMSGDIDMAEHAITDLPDPTNPQDAATKAYASAPGTTQTKGARAYHNVNQAVPNTTNSILSFNSERYDTDAIHGGDVPLSRLLCKTAGKYVITGHVNWEGNGAGIRFLNVLLNGATNIAITGGTPRGAVVWRQSVATVYYLAVNDFIEIRVWQDSGGALNVNSSGNYSPEFAMQRIG